MSNPSNAAKAASIMHHTSGATDAVFAYRLYDRLQACEDDDEILAVLQENDCPMWSAVEDLSPAEWWENVETLAGSIDNCREELA